MQNFDNSDYAANFTAAYEAGSEETQRAPFRTPISISRKRNRRSRYQRAIPGFGHWEAVDRRHASDTQREQMLADEFYGASTSPEDALIDMIDGRNNQDDEEPLVEEREYFVDGLTEQEKELVLRFPNDDEELHPMVTQVINPPTQDVINRWRSIFMVGIMTDPLDKMLAELRVKERAEWECFTYTITRPFKPELEPIDREDETEAHRASDEYHQSMMNARKRRFRQYVNIRRRARKGGKIKCVRNRGQKHRRYNIDRATPRYEQWSEQLPFYSTEAWLEDNMQEAFEEEMSARECDEDMEAEAAGSTEEQFQQYLNEAERAFRIYALNYAVDCRLMAQSQKVAA